MESIHAGTSDVVSLGNSATGVITSHDESKGGGVGSNLMYLVTLEDRHRDSATQKGDSAMKTDPIYLYAKECQELLAKSPAARCHMHLLIAESSLRQEAM